MKKAFEFVKDNFMYIVMAIVSLVLICAWVIPFVYGTSAIFWQWALNPTL